MRLDLFSGVLMAGAIALAPSTAMAEVVLKSNDGTSSLRGTISSLVDGVYTIETTIGTLQVQANLVTCEGTDCPNYEPLDQLVRIAGPSSLVTDLVPSLLDDYALAAEADSLQVRSGGSGASSVVFKQGADLLATFELQPNPLEEAFQALLDGEVEIVVSDRPVNLEEIESFLAAGLGDLSQPGREAIVALDGITPMVSRSNPVKKLDIEQLTGVFAGDITNWSELGGNDAQINVYLPQDGGTMAASFEQALLEPEFLNFTSSAQMVPRMEDVSAAVVRDPHGIGLSSLSIVPDEEQLGLVADCGLPIRQNRFAVKSEDYPFSRRMYMYTADRNLPSRAVKFVQTASISSAKEGITDAGYFGLDAEVAGIGEHGDQLAFALADPSQANELQNLRNFAQEVIGAGRLSVTFRFRTGSSQLDNKAAVDAARLAALMADDELSGRDILLVGFTDSIGASDVNALLSQRRAEQVLDRIAAEAGNAVDLSRVRTLGFGAAFPVACNTTEAGRQINRRVEVWLR